MNQLGGVIVVKIICSGLQNGATLSLCFPVHAYTLMTVCLFVYLCMHLCCLSPYLTLFLLYDNIVLLFLKLPVSLVVCTVRICASTFFPSTRFISLYILLCNARDDDLILIRCNLIYSITQHRSNMLQLISYRRRHLMWHQVRHWQAHHCLVNVGILLVTQRQRSAALRCRACYVCACTHSYAQHLLLDVYCWWTHHGVQLIFLSVCWVMQLYEYWVM